MYGIIYQHVPQKIASYTSFKNTCDFTIFWICQIIIEDDFAPGIPWPTFRTKP